MSLRPVNDENIWEKNPICDECSYIDDLYTQVFSLMKTTGNDDKIETILSILNHHIINGYKLLRTIEGNGYSLLKDENNNDYLLLNNHDINFNNFAANIHNQTELDIIKKFNPNFSENIILSETRWCKKCCKRKPDIKENGNE